MKPSLLRRTSACAIAALTIALGASAASADDIYNDIDTSIDSTAEVMPLTVDGADGSTTLYVNATGTGNNPADGKSGCNLTGSTTLTVSVTSSDPSKATVSPSSLTFDGCGATRVLTVTAVAAGQTTVTLAQTSNNSGGTFDLSRATFRVDVAPSQSNTAPTVQVTGVTGGTAYEHGSVPAASCSVTDAQDGPSSFAATLSAISGPLAAHGLGEQTASCSYQDDGGLTATSSVTYSIVDRTAPVITFVNLSPAANAAGWNNTNVTATWTCSDNVAIDSAASTTSVTVSSEGAGQSATGTCTDVSGNTASNTVTGINIDKTLPVITLQSRLPAANADGWNNTNVTATWTCSDDNLASAASPSVTVSNEAEGQSATGTCTDIAGNTVSNTVTDIDIDKTNPTITAALSPARPASNWWNVASGAPTVTYSCGDTLSGVAACPAAHTFGEGADQSDSKTVYDLAGNSATAGVSDVDVDLTGPGVIWSGGPTDGGSYYFGSVPAAGTCTATDGLSGPGGCAITGYETTTGSKTLTATASDVAGNTTAATRSYTVLAWTLGGFFQPVDMGGVWNTVKNGSTVPLKFEVFAGATELTDTSVVDSFTVKAVTCPGASAPADEVEFVTTGATMLRYDATGGQFIQNWQTPKKPGACYQVTMTTDDGSSLSANFKLK